MAHVLDRTDAMGSSCSPSRNTESTDASINKENCASPRTGDLSPLIKGHHGPLKLDQGDEESLIDITDLHIRDSETGEHDKGRQETEGGFADTRGLPHHGEGDGLFHRENGEVYQYFLDKVPVALELQELREKGWTSAEGDEYFKKQKWHTDNADLDTSRNFMNMMRIAANQMEAATGIFSLGIDRPTILAFGFAPGGFVQKALELNPTAQAIGITLSNKLCGIPILVKDKRLTFYPADITLMAADMGMLPDEIPRDHPDARNFLPKMIRPRAMFDLVMAEGGVLRPHQTLLGSHRRHEQHRLMASQLALSLSRVKPGGRMIVLMHKPETWNSLVLFYTFSKFAKIQLFKPSQKDHRAPHQYKSSFYMLAQNIQSQSDAARAAVKQWTQEWKAATFGTYEEYEKVVLEQPLCTEQVLREFGEEWIRMSMQVWEAQCAGLKAKSFTKD